MNLNIPQTFPYRPFHGFISGICVIESIFLCKNDIVRQRKTHRKKRINKKWAKRYGFITFCPGVAYETPMGIIVCPCVLSRIKEECQHGTPSTLVRSRLDSR